MEPTRQERPAGLPPDVVDALRRGQRIEAIRLLRAKAGVDLAQARRLIDERRAPDRLHDRAHSQLHGMITEDRANTRLLVIAAILAAALLVWKYFIDV